MGYVASENGLRSIREWHQRMGYVASENGLRSMGYGLKHKRMGYVASENGLKQNYIHASVSKYTEFSENWNTIYGQNLKNTDEKCAITHFITMPLFFHRKI